MPIRNVAITTTSNMTYTGGTLPNTVLKVTSSDSES